MKSKQCSKRKRSTERDKKKQRTGKPNNASREEKRTTTKCRKTQGKTINVLQNDTISGNFKFLRSELVLF